MGVSNQQHTEPLQLTLHQWRSQCALQARIKKKLDEELPQESMGGIKLGPKVSWNQGLSKS